MSRVTSSSQEGTAALALHLQVLFEGGEGRVTCDLVWPKPHDEGDAERLRENCRMTGGQDYRKPARRLQTRKSLATRSFSSDLLLQV